VKRRFMRPALCVSSFFLLTLGCGLQARSLRVLLPQPMQTASTEFSLDNNRVRIVVTFNRPVALNSLLPRQNVLLQTPQNADADTTIQAGPTPLEAVITSVDDASVLFPAGTSAFTLRLLGSGATPITATTGLGLDQDPTTAAIDDYQTMFTITR